MSAGMDTDTKVQTRLRALADAAGSQAKLAKRMGISAVYLSDILSGKRGPGPTVLDYLGLEKTIRRKAK